MRLRVQLQLIHGRQGDGAAVLQQAGGGALKQNEDLSEELYENLEGENLDEAQQEMLE